MSVFELLLWPFLCCLVLTGIHVYLGLHVVQRGVIFVDLSLAQIAALGTTIAFLLGFGLHSQISYYFSLGFTLIGAALFTLARFEKKKIPQEAFIGIVYVVSVALSILIIDSAPDGAEHIKYILVGNLLSVTPYDVMKMAALYSVIGIAHWIWRKPLLDISFNIDQARKDNLSIKKWDFFFYGSFGVVVTSSVSIAGVLMVFSFLIVPCVTAMLFTEKLGHRLLIGWATGTLVSLIGMIASYTLDTPTGATVIVAFGLVLITAITIQKLFYSYK